MNTFSISILNINYSDLLSHGKPINIHSKSFAYKYVDQSSLWSQNESSSRDNNTYLVNKSQKNVQVFDNISACL